MAHLNIYHSSVLHSRESSVKQISIQSAFGKLEVKPFSQDSRDHKDITKKLTEWIVKDLVPLSAVSNQHFKEFVGALNPRYSMPCSKTMTNVIIPQVYGEVKARLLSELDAIQHFGVTTDA